MTRKSGGSFLASDILTQDTITTIRQALLVLQRLLALIHRLAVLPSTAFGVTQHFLLLFMQRTHTRYRSMQTVALAHRQRRQSGRTKHFGYQAQFQQEVAISS
jgi:hypothetical protein